MSLKNRRYKRGGGIDEDIDEIDLFLTNFGENKIRMILCDIIYYKLYENIPKKEYYKRYEYYSLKQLLNELSKNYSIEEFKKNIYVDILLRLRGFLTNSYEREITNNKSLKEIKEEIRKKFNDIIDKAINEIDLFLKNFDENKIRMILSDIIFYKLYQQIPQKEEEYYKKYNDYTLNEILEYLNYMSYDLDNIFKDILLRLNDLLPNNEERKKIEISDEEIKEEIRKEFKIDKEIDEILLFLSDFNEIIIRMTLSEIIFFIKNNVIPQNEYYKQYEAYSLKQLLKELSKNYNKEEFNKKIYVDILLRLNKLLPNNEERKKIEISDEEIKEKIRKELKNIGGSYRKQIIKKVIRKY